jgi:CubicO group peptidase (beta-lactamase class C family)
MRIARPALLLALLSSIAAHGAPPAPTKPAAPPPVAEAAKPELIARDSPFATAAGTTFTVPAGWTLMGGAAQRVLEGPEKDIRLAVVDVPARSADDAVKAAWPALEPKFARNLRIAQDRPARSGWESRRVYVYETSPNEKRVVVATAQKRGASWTVLLLDGSEAVQERRGGQIRLVLDSLRPAGYKKESFAGKKPHALDAARIELLKDFVEKARAASGTAGVAISLIQDGKVVFAGGFGVRELGKPERVDADTLFLVASNTKALTTLLLAREVDQGKFRWDTPVTQIYPAFRLGDANVTKSVQMKHLVCACTGLPRQDMEWLFEYRDATPASGMKLLGTFTPTSKFGEAFQYSNLMASAAGFIGGHLLYPDKELGAAYDEAMRTQVFAPLGMTATTFDFARALATNHASAHGQDVDGNAAIEAMSLNESIIPFRPAGGAWSSVNDMSRYVLMELAGGKLPDGSRYVSETALLERRAPQVPLGENKSYGMGLMVDKTWGVTEVHHGGDLFGHHSDMFWLPEAGVGGVILASSDPGVMIRGPFVRRVLEVLYDGNPEAEEDVMSAIKRDKEQLATERKRLVVPADPAVASKLAARYTNASLGELAVAARGKSTVFDAGEWQSEVASRKNDDGTVSLITITPGMQGLELVPAEKGGKRTLTVRDAQHEYVFMEK